MLLTIVSVIYVLVAVAMIALILMQRGSGAAAGSGFGAGASATVFGARGSANFLSTSTKWLAVLFFAMTLGIAYYHKDQRVGPVVPVQDDDLGIMGDAGGIPAAPAGGATVPATDPAVPAASADGAQAPADAPAIESRDDAAEALPEASGEDAENAGNSSGND